MKDKEKNEKMFTLFPKLPKELRDDIWNKSVIPRLVHFHPGGGKAPGVLFFNKESRKATRGHYLVCFVPLKCHGQYALFVNFKMDNVYRKQGGLPNMVKQYNFPCQPIDIPDHLTTSVVIKADLFWNVQPWIRHLKVFTTNLDIAAKSNRFTPQITMPWWARRAHGVTRLVAEGQTIWVKIKAICPDLEELNVVLNERLEKGTALEELVESDTGDLQDTEQQRLIKIVRDDLESHRTKGDLVSLMLNFLDLVLSTPM
ncbi:hypothetical protein IFR05_013087 [Cadophora sp. M221]|nr:hypothetical protein IFR05_013087 [Cadophora sp. M221]